MRSEPTAQSVSGPVRILSDLHFGHPSSRIREVAMLRPLLEGSTKVVFNGDTCEQLYSGWSGEGERLRCELVALCQRMGVEPLFLRGNHDPEISQGGWVTVCDGKVMITHGDLIMTNPSPWSREYLRKKAKVQAVIRARGEGDGSLLYRWETLEQINAAMVPEETPGGKSRLTSHLLSALWPPERFYQILRVWMMMGRNAEAFVERFAPDCRVFLFGHFHRAAVLTRGGRLFCNTGGYVGGTGALVVDVGEDEVVVRKVVEESGEFRMGEVTKRFPLSGQCSH